MEFYKKILENNKRWAAEKLAGNPDFFNNLKDTQQPLLLWIGCSDSRVPAEQIIGAQPGEVFVHRNIANMVVPSDMNFLGVLDYAVNVLKVEHVIVCGHYGCGGVKAAMGNQSVGVIDNWIQHIKESLKEKRGEHALISDAKERWDKNVEWNTVQQVKKLASTSIMQNAWQNGQAVTIHGWVYSIENGEVVDLEVDMQSNEALEDAGFKLLFS